MIEKSGLPGIHYIKSELLSDLQAYYPVNTCLAEADIIYLRHIPIAAYILYEGAVELSKRKSVATLLPGAIIGAREIYKNKIFRFNARVSKGSKVMILDKSTLLELLQHRHLPIKNSFIPVLE